MAEDVKNNETSGLSSSFYKNLVVLATILGGFMYVENSMKTSIYEAIRPYVDRQIELEGATKENSNKINFLEQENKLNSYKWTIYEQQIKDFLKPDEVTLKKN